MLLSIRVQKKRYINIKKQKRSVNTDEKDYAACHVVEYFYAIRR
jgi:hypothetical protein